MQPAAPSLAACAMSVYLSRDSGISTVITNSGTYPLVDPERPAIKLSSSRGVAFENYSYSGKAGKMLQTDATCQDTNLE